MFYCYNYFCYSQYSSQSLPVLWDLTGETCREIAKQTAGVSLEDTDIKQRLDTLVLTWSRLSQSVLNDGASSISQCELSPLNPVATDGLPLSCITRSVSSPTGPGDAMATGQSKRAKARAKAKMRAKENSATSDGQVKELREVLGNSVTTRNWQMLAGSLPTISPDIASERLPYGRIQKDFAVVVDRPDPIRALHDIHSMVAPLVLCDLEHLTCVQQLNICVRSMHFSECSETERECESIDITLDSLFPHVALTPAVVHAVGAEKGCQDELRVILLMTYCFLSAALLHHLKAIGGIKHHTRNDGGANNRYCTVP